MVNNWFVTLNACRAVTSDWAFLYFCIFFCITVLIVINLVVAFLLEAVDLVTTRAKERRKREKEERVMRKRSVEFSTPGAVQCFFLSIFSSSFIGLPSLSPPPTP